MWINYMAATRITQETDDVWGNLCVYRHNKTGTWWPGAYDMNLSFGQYYKEAGWTDFWGGEISNEDTFKCHPLYGGSQSVRKIIDRFQSIGGTGIICSNPDPMFYGKEKGLKVIASTIP